MNLEERLVQAEKDKVEAVKALDKEIADLKKQIENSKISGGIFTSDCSGRLVGITITPAVRKQIEERKDGDVILVGKDGYFSWMYPSDFNTCKHFSNVETI